MLPTLPGDVVLAEDLTGGHNKRVVGNVPRLSARGAAEVARP